MDASDKDQTNEPFRDDLVAYLAKRLGVSHEVARSTLGDWLLHFERRQAPPGGARRY